MPNEPLALSDLLAGLPDEADYDTVYAAIMATEPGRRFLNEYTDRNRQAASEALTGAITQVESAIRGAPAPGVPPAFGRDLADVAAGIDRIETEIAAGAGPSLDHSDVVERLQDIAFVLHERPIEASLCDGLDTAIREVANAFARMAANSESSRNAVRSLHGVAGRLRDMIALVSAGRSTGDTGAGNMAAAADAASDVEDAGISEYANDTGVAPHVPLLNLAAGDDAAVARVVAALATSAPPLAAGPEPASDVQPEPIAATEPAPATQGEADGVQEAIGAEDETFAALPVEHQDDPEAAAQGETVAALPAEQLDNPEIVAAAEEHTETVETVEAVGQGGVVTDALSAMPGNAEEDAIRPAAPEEASAESVVIETPMTVEIAGNDTPRAAVLSDLVAENLSAGDETLSAARLPEQEPVETVLESELAQPPAGLQPSESLPIALAEVQPPRDEPSFENTIPSPADSTDGLPGLDEDPGDLFEPLQAPPVIAPVVAVTPLELPEPVMDAPPTPAIEPAITTEPSAAPQPSAAAMPIDQAEVGEEARSSASVQTAPARPAAPAPMPRPASRPDPLAAVRALSEEELIALFS